MCQFNLAPKGHPQNVADHDCVCFLYLTGPVLDPEGTDLFKLPGNTETSTRLIFALPPFAIDQTAMLFYLGGLRREVAEWLKALPC